MAPLFFVFLLLGAYYSLRCFAHCFALPLAGQVLQDRERLVKRTQLKRSVYHVLGREEETEEVEESHDSHLKSHDQEIYDEDDFYHQVSVKCVHSDVE